MLAAVRARLASRLDEELEKLGVDDLRGRRNDDVARSVVSPLLAFPQLATKTAVVTTVVEGLGIARNDGEASSQTKVPSRILVIRWPISGDSTLLELWPNGIASEPPDDEQLRPEAPYTWNRPSSQFTVESGHVWSYVEVSALEESVPMARDALLATREGQLLRYMHAHQQALETAVQVIVDETASEIDHLRTGMNLTEALLNGLELSPMQPEVIEMASEPSSTEHEIALPLPSLSDPTFSTIVTAICRWAREIEKYPRHLADLSEDGLTTALCATLTLVFGMADHDVFVNNGHGDLVINAARLMELQGLSLPQDETEVFVAEAKKGSGPALATGALDQLANYLTRRSRHGALIYYIDAADFEGAYRRILEALRNHVDFRRNSRSPLDGRTDVLEFQDPTTRRIVTVAAVGVALSSTGPQTTEAEKRRAARVNDGSELSR